MFRGTFEHGIDAKGRTSLPARFREVLAGRQEEHLVVTKGHGPSLWCYPPAAWAEIEAKVRALPQMAPQTIRFMRGFIAPAQDCKLDGMGRVLVPPPLRAYAKLDGPQVMWAGMIDRLELWSLEGWKKNDEESGSLFDDPSFGQMLGI